MTFLWRLLVLSLLLAAAIGSKAATDDSECDLWNDREIFLMGESSVSDLFQILQNWRNLVRAMDQYAAGKSNTRVSTCTIKDLSIESIKGISRYSQQDLREYHPDIAKRLESTDAELQSLVTTHSCFAASVERNITWYFLLKDGEYSVIEHAVAM